jgi:hypothetical protein
LAQSAKDNQKFTFGHVKQGSRARDLKESLQWLISAGPTHKVHFICNSSEIIRIFFRLAEEISTLIQYPLTLSFFPTKIIELK